MGHVKLIVFGIVLVGVVVFGTIFWSDFSLNQQEIANTPLPPSPEVDDVNILRQEAMAGMSSDDSYDPMERDLDQTDVNNMDSDSTQLEAELITL